MDLAIRNSQAGRSPRQLELAAHVLGRDLEASQDARRAAFDVSHQCEQQVLDHNVGEGRPALLCFVLAFLGPLALLRT